MKGIALSTIAYILIAIVSVSLLITYIGLNFSPLIRKAYCSFLLGLTSFLPLPESLQPSIPSFCKVEPSAQVIEIESGDVSFISQKIAAYSLACWEITGEVNLGNDRNCYELVLKRVNGVVKEENVTSFLPQGYENIIDWKIGDITSPKSVGIYYNSTSNKIEVI